MAPLRGLQDNRSGGTQSFAWDNKDCNLQKSFEAEDGIQFDPSEDALTRIPLVNHFANFVVVAEFATIGDGDPLADLSPKPIVIAHHSFDGFDH